MKNHMGWRWPALGMAGSLALAASGPALVDTKAVRWWYALHIPPGRTATGVVFYLGVAALSAAWLGLGWRLRRSPETRPVELVLIGSLWALPLVLGPALFSLDMYSYIAQGTIVHLGLSPYHHTPAVLAHFHDRHVLDAVSPFWRHTTAPYGPLYLGLVSLIVGVIGSSHLILTVLALRLLDLVGLGLLAVYVPRLARALGADPSRATWLAVISPLVLLELIAAGHNDALMIGLLVAGVTLAAERRPLLAIAVCALAATVKVPAAVAIVFIAVAWARDDPRHAARVGALAGAVTIAVVAGVIVATGLGFGWLSGNVLATPGKVRLAITPVTAVAYSLRGLLHGVGISSSLNAIASVLSTIALALTAALALVLAYRTRYEKVAFYVGVVLLVSVLSGPAAWPWYLTWGVALVACTPTGQRWLALPAILALAVFLVKPSGTLVLPLHTAPIVLVVYVVAGVALWRHIRRQGADQLKPRADHRLAGEPPLFTSAESTP